MLGTDAAETVRGLLPAWAGARFVQPCPVTLSAACGGCPVRRRVADLVPHTPSGNSWPCRQFQQVGGLLHVRLSLPALHR